jgi:WD40 repeat protein
MRIDVAMYAIEWFPDGNRFASGGFEDNTVYVYAMLMYGQ